MSVPDLAKLRVVLDRSGLPRGALALGVVLLLSGLVFFTGGGDSPWFFGYFFAALGIGWAHTRAGAAVAGFALVVGYLAASAAAVPTTFALAPELWKAGILALFCAVAGYMGFRTQGAEKRASDLASDLSTERDRAARAEGLSTGFGPVLKGIRLEGALAWTAEAARSLAGGSYVHVGALRANDHITILEDDALDVCPSWQHPTIQRLLLESCRERRAVRSDEIVHGIEGFMAVPVCVAQEEPWGAIVLGGNAFGAKEERGLEHLAEGLVPALQRDNDALGGLDEISGLPNRASLYRALHRDLSLGRAPTVLATELEGYRDYVRSRGPAAGDALIRRVGERFRDTHRRVFRYGDDRFVVVFTGSDERRARSTAAAMRRLVFSEIEGAGHVSSPPAVGFAFAGIEEDPDSILDAALGALDAARAKRGRISGPVADSNGKARVSGAEHRQTTEIVAALVEALEAKNAHIKEHLRGVSSLALRLGQKMSLDPDQMEALAVGALLHDVGKIGIPDRVLHKPGRLTLGEYESMKDHPVLGAAIIAPLGRLTPALPVVKHHHERFDGGGYPDGLRGEEIPLIARIVAVADAYDTMLRARPYDSGLPKEAALEEVARNRGTQFDPVIANLLPLVVGGHDEGRVGFAG